MRRLIAVGSILGTLAVLFLATQAGAHRADAKKAVCDLMATSGSQVSGHLEFTQMGDIVEIKGEIKGLKPGKHGFHVHDGSECGPDGMKAAGHFNPSGAKHGGPHDNDRHVGDLGNVEAGTDGTAKIDIKDKIIRLEGKSNVIGHALVVHEKADDLKSQPSGDAGGRIGCGIIKEMK